MAQILESEWLAIIYLKVAWAGAAEGLLHGPVGVEDLEPGRAAPVPRADLEQTDKFLPDFSDKKLRIFCALSKVKKK